MVDEWKSSGRFIDTPAGRIFAARQGSGGDPILYLHGFPTSSYDLRLALPRLTAAHPVVVHDHLGFGLSDKPAGYAYSLFGQADAALAVWRALGIERGHVVAHDYGTSIATELLARREDGNLPIDLRSVTLTNGSVIIELAHLSIAQRLLRGPLGPSFARVAGRHVFLASMRRLFGDPARMPDMNADFDLLSLAAGRNRLPRISRYLEERVRYGPRWTAALAHADVPLRLVWGDRDPIAVPAIARRVHELAPNSQITWLDGVGHYPMLEAPDRWADAILSGLG
jgi:pimeloyl-ACP methyl ester carboxylesterase